ncbi:MAG: glycosylhydrolase-like jelly roll fold domain-containing protein [bacterium]
MPLFLWKLEEVPHDIPRLLSLVKNISSGLVIDASPRSKEVVRRICNLAKTEGIPIFLSLPPLSPFTSHLQATRVGLREGERIELPLEEAPLWIGAISSRASGQPTIIDLKSFHQEGYLKWTAPSGIWDILIITAPVVEKRENPLEAASFWLEELSDLIPPLSGFYIPSIELTPFPWRDDLPQEFQRRRGYPLHPSFPSLALDLEEKSLKFRYDFRRTVYEIWEETLTTLYNYIKRKGLSLLVSFNAEQHCWGEMLTLSSHTPFSVLHPSSNPILNEFATTLLSSASTTLLMLNIDLSSSPEEIKRNIDNFASLGASGAIFRLPLQEIESTLWEEVLPILSSYQARLSLLSSRFPRNKGTVMLLPRLSLWSHQRLVEDDEYFRAVERDLFYLCELLHKIHYDFLFLDEEELPNCEGLKTVLLPSITTMKRSTLSWLEKFYDAGGNVIALGMLPFRTEEGRNEALENAVRSLFKVNVEDLNNLYLLSSTMGMESGVVYAIGRIHPFSQGKVYSYQPAVNPDRGEALRQTRQILRNCQPPDLDSLLEDVLCLPRGENLFLLFNKGERLAKLNAMLPIDGLPSFLNIEKGIIKRIYTYSLMEDGRIIIPLELNPGELCAVLIEEGKESHIDQANFSVEELKAEGRRILLKGWQKGGESLFAVIEVDDERHIVEAEASPPPLPISLTMDWNIKPEGPNLLPLSNWCYRKKEGFWKSLFSGKKEGEWLPLPPGYSPQGEVWYRATFSLLEPLQDVSLSVEHPIESILVNGRRAKAGTEISLKGFLQEGENTLVILINHAKSPRLPQAFLKGDFSLSFLEGGWVLSRRKPTIQIGSWTEQGFPFYVGTMEYRANFHLSEEHLGKKAVLSLGLVKEVVEVFINGRKAGFLFSSPWELEIGDFLKEGENEIILKITNRPPSVYGEQAPVSGLLAPAGILFFNFVELEFLA